MRVVVVAQRRGFSRPVARPAFLFSLWPCVQSPRPQVLLPPHHPRRNWPGGSRDPSTVAALAGACPIRGSTLLSNRSPRAGARSKGHRTWSVYVRSLEPKNAALWPCCFGATFAEIRIIRAVTQLLTRLEPVRNFEFRYDDLKCESRLIITETYSNLPRSRSLHHPN